MRFGRPLRRGVRAALRWWWQSARPSTAAVTAGDGVARPEHVAGRPPTPGERWQPSSPATGAWASVDPHATPQWPRRGSLAVVAVWGALVGLRVRRDLRGSTERHEA